MHPFTDYLIRAGILVRIETTHLIIGVIDVRTAVIDRRFAIAFTVAPVLAPFTYGLLLMMADAVFGTRKTVGDGSVLLVLVLWGAPIAYFDAAFVLILVYLITGRRGLLRPWLLAVVAFGAGAVTMIVIARRDPQWSLVLPGALAGSVSSFVFSFTAFRKFKAVKT